MIKEYAFDHYVSVISSDPVNNGLTGEIISRTRTRDKTVNIYGVRDSQNQKGALVWIEEKYLKQIPSQVQFSFLET